LKEVENIEKKFSNSVWVGLKGMIIEKIIKEGMNE